ncbi:MAG TPA: hypothetical protein ENO06_00880 [Methanolinea sp.]|nr:hypothetical protein [Methanolinea sp.]
MCDTVTADTGSDQADPYEAGMNLMQTISDAEEYQRDDYYIHCRNSFYRGGVLVFEQDLLLDRIISIILVFDE